MSQQEEARRALDQFLANLDGVPGVRCVALSQQLGGSLTLGQLREISRALTATAPQTQAQIEAWLAIEDVSGVPWRHLMHTKPDPWQEGQQIVPLYRGAAPQVQETESR